MLYVQLLIHTGMHKSASTYLQAVLRNNRATLAGVGIALAASGPVINHFAPSSVAKGHVADSPWQRHIRRTRDSGADNMILTSEKIELLLRDPERFAWFREEIADFDGVSFMTVVREPMDYQSSLKQHRIKTLQGGEYPVRVPKTGAGVDMDYNARFGQLLASGLPATWIPYQEVRSMGGPRLLEREIATAFSIDVNLEVDVAPRNSGLGAHGSAVCAFIRFAIHEGIDKSKSPSEIAIARLPDNLRHEVRGPIVAEIRETITNPGRYFAYTPQQVTDFREAQRDLNNAFAQQAWQQPWDDIMPTDTPSRSLFSWSDTDKHETALGLAQSALVRTQTACQKFDMRFDAPDLRRSLDRYVQWTETLSD